MGDDGARQLSPFFRRRRIERNRAGAYELHLTGDDRLVLQQVVPQFDALFEDPTQPVLRRLFPPAYADPADAKLAEEYRRLMSEDLVARHREELQLLASTAQADTLSEEQLLAWSRALNSVRLVLGTALDVTEDDEDKAIGTPEGALYRKLTELLDDAIDALEGS